MLPRELRTAGLAVLQSMRALGAFCSSLAFGFAWAQVSSRTVIYGFIITLVIALAAAVALVRPESPFRSQLGSRPKPRSAV